MVPGKPKKQHPSPEVPSLRLLPKVDRYEPNSLQDRDTALLTKTSQIPGVDKGVHSGKTELFNPQISP